MLLLLLHGDAEAHNFNCGWEEGANVIADATVRVPTYRLAWEWPCARNDVVAFCHLAKGLQLIQESSAHAAPY
jgi:hypothetical protein